RDSREVEVTFRCPEPCLTTSVDDMAPVTPGHPAHRTPIVDTNTVIPSGFGPTYAQIAFGHEELRRQAAEARVVRDVRRRRLRRTPRPTRRSILWSRLRHTS